MSGRARRVGTRAAALLGVCLGLAGCAGPVEVAPPPGAPERCESVAALWPERVADEDRVDTTPRSPLTAAWGSPAIIARCGVPVPGPTTSECVAVDDVDWIVEPLEDGTRLTTYGRDPAIEVLVPQDYSPAPLLLPAFGAAARVSERSGPGCT